MNRVRTGGIVCLIAAAVVCSVWPAAAWAQQCPAELDAAKKALMSAAPAGAPRTLVGAREEIQSPRGQEIQSPRGQDIQSPRGQEIQSPRGQDIQSPRGQEIQSPRQDTQSPRSEAGAKSSGVSPELLIQESEAACKAGDMALSTQKARAALEALK